MAGPSSIEYFKNTFLKHGLARPSRYNVEITTTARQTINFQPETVTLPNRAFRQIVDDVYGPIRKVPIARDFSGTVLLTFPVSENQQERSFFESWMDEIIPGDSLTKGPLGTVNMARYTNPFGQGGKRSVHGNMTIKTIGMDEAVTSTYMFNEAYPQTIIPVQLGQNMFNDYQRLTVEMEYRDYTYSSTTSDYSSK